MAIEKDSILAFVNDAMRTSEAAVDSQILTVLNDLNLHALLEKEATGSIVSGDESVPKPTGYKSYISLTLTAAGSTGKPLLPMEGGFRAIERQRASTDDSGLGQPGWYAPAGDNIEIWPAAGKAYTYSFDHYYKHPEDVENIEFDDSWENVFNFGATYYMALARGREKYIGIWQPVYIDARETRILAQPKHIRIAGGV